MKKTLLAVGVLLFSLSHSLVWAKSDSWSLYTSENFEMYSDIKKRDAEKLLKEFERFREVLFAVTGLERQPESSRLKIIKYADNNDFRKLTDDLNTVGYYLSTNAGPRMLVGPSFNIGSNRVLHHEYVHLFIDQYGNQNYPRWYDEGFAELLAATKMNSTSIILGAIPDYRARDLRPLGDNGSLGKVSILELITEINDNDTAQYRQRFYATAWLFMHYIQISPVSNELPLQEQTSEFNRRVALGESPRAAFKASYGMTTRQMDAEIKKYFMLSRFPEIKLKIPQYKGKVSKQKISESHANFIMADIAYRANESDAALEYLENINNNDENASRALALKALLLNEIDTKTESDNLAKQAHKLGENDAITLTYLSQIKWDAYQELKQDAKSDSVLLDTTIELSKAATQADPQSQEAFTLQARALAEKSLNPEALKSYMAAYQINPTSVSLNSEIGEFLLSLKEPQLARRFFERVYLRAHSKKQRVYAKNKMDEIDNTKS